MSYSDYRMMNKEKILLVDDDPNVLQGYQRSLRKKFDIETALCSEEALTAVNFLGPFAVIVSDMNMPRENGVQLLQRFLRDSPDIVRIMLTGNADQQTASDAINKSRVFRFLNKPCKPDDLAEAIAAAIEQHRLITAERDLLTKTVRGSISMMNEILSVVNPVAFGRSARLRKLVAELAPLAKLDRPWEVEIAAMLSQVGCVNIRPELLEKALHGDALAEEEVNSLAGRYEFARALICQIPRLENVASIVALLDDQHFAATPEKEIPPAVHLLRIARDFDKLLQQELDDQLALARLQQQANLYDSSSLEALRLLVERQPDYESREAKIGELEPGWILASDVKTTAGMLLVKSGQEISSSLLLRLKNHSFGDAIADPITVLVPLETLDGPTPVAELALTN